LVGERRGAIVGLIAQLLNPSTWGGMLQASIDDVGRGPFWIDVLGLILINMLLSGDNAVIIAMACRGLPGRQRLWGLVIGAGVAVLLRIIFTVVIARLLLLPYLKLAGGLVLLFIAAKLLVPEDGDDNDVAAAPHLWRAVRIVVVADIVMSFDNIVAVAALARGDLTLLAIGLFVSIPLIVAGAALITALLDRFPILVWAGAALLGWVAGETIVSDPAVLSYVTNAVGEKSAGQIELAAACAATVLVIAAGGLWRRWQTSKTRA
jgi:YjbE family integral membrane protein